jgi:hypothetical protein
LRVHFGGWSTGGGETDDDQDGVAKRVQGVGFVVVEIDPRGALDDADFEIVIVVRRDDLLDDVAVITEEVARALGDGVADVDDHPVAPSI